mmetsp:Transcript_1612/g.3963  ORF Transcript_1612/g.3963 Transcript_1612/m.3963 type:complete len:228 (-) Transcript_1612:373-1056(-)|eukprot:CAMPEP_0116831710 /NCGR_PEP_ID=MMETSP0418-20121206/5492_1 /TAXON_ID=1158023 /ORGANISM="Astrosyne radiata, Strain 13vi08-1A" /LENGTH=227 /DNA_ID=CAMNT_0004460999 /DNA_START=21 /DNA_END=704 /DNA_ORIENTATION=-
MEQAKVQFAEDDQECAPIPQWYLKVQDDEEKKQQWWLDDENKLSAYDTVDWVLCGSDSLWASTERQSYCSTLSQVHDACIGNEAMSVGLQQDLLYWSRVGNSRRGLERYIVEEIQQFRDQRISHVRASVMFVQDACRTTGSMTKDQKADLIRNVSESVSHTAIRYAAIMGAADEASARFEHDEEIPQGETREQQQQHPKDSKKVNLFEMQTTVCLRGESRCTRSIVA